LRCIAPLRTGGSSARVEDFEPTAVVDDEVLSLVQGRELLVDVLPGQVRAITRPVRIDAGVPPGAGLAGRDVALPLLGRHHERDVLAVLGGRLQPLGYLLDVLEAVAQLCLEGFAIGQLALDLVEIRRRQWAVPAHVVGGPAVQLVAKLARPFFCGKSPWTRGMGDASGRGGTE